MKTVNEEPQQPTTETLPPGDFSCSARLEGSTLLLTPKGEIDFATRPALNTIRQLISPRLSTVRINLHNVPFMDSTAVNFLTSLQTGCRQFNIQLEITGLNLQQRKLLEIFTGHPLLTLLPKQLPHTAHHGPSDGAVAALRRPTQHQQRSRIPALTMPGNGAHQREPQTSSTSG
ncbi:STAS domain-containing protein [Streptomyces sp. NPDC006283]|uniref:STAS domain-containing protein n=1 Tax=Streptomyces sp. NPDC006283 TaxID=3156741 RepID=UPI0033A02A77